MAMVETFTSNKYGLCQRLTNLLSLEILFCKFRTSMFLCRFHGKIYIWGCVMVSEEDSHHEPNLTLLVFIFIFSFLNELWTEMAKSKERDKRKKICWKIYIYIYKNINFLRFRMEITVAAEDLWTTLTRVWEVCVVRDFKNFKSWHYWVFLTNNCASCCVATVLVSETVLVPFHLKKIRNSYHWNSKFTLPPCCNRDLFSLKLYLSKYVLLPPINFNKMFSRN